MQIEKRILTRELTYDNNVVLEYRIEYPEMVSKDDIASNKFNQYNKNLAINLQNKVENELYQEAVELYKYNKQNNYPIMKYEVVRTYEITLNINQIISLYADEYIFSGGAHGNTIRTSQTWDMNIARMINLYELFRNPYFIINILRQIIAQKDIYFEDACCLVIETFNSKSFYLTQSYIAIYFQQYDIAPYSSGIRTFMIR